ncbi:MAG: hypothetical protein N2316_07220 [Spirochaetes bacterium]|nr:hypothetical protein [Spirochaetota bacterium]
MKHRTFYIRGVGTLLCFALTICNIFSNESENSQNASIATNNLFADIISKDPVVRDHYVEIKEGIVVYGKAICKNTSTYLRYDRQFRIIASPIEDNVNFIYYLFTNNKKFFRRLKTGSVFEFKGKLMIATSINLSKDAYILDIVLEE